MRHSPGALAGLLSFAAPASGQLTPHMADSTPVTIPQTPIKKDMRMKTLLFAWKYGWPIGIPFGKSFKAEGEGFPGYIREYGVSLNYQRFLRNRLFAQADVMPAWQTFVNDSGDKIDQDSSTGSRDCILGISFCDVI